MKKFLVLIFILCSCTDSIDNFNSDNSDINEHVIKNVDLLWEDIWAENFDYIDERILALGKNCNSYPENTLHFDVFILCKTLLFDFTLKYLNDDEIYESDTEAIADIFNESKDILELIKKLDYTNESFYGFIEILLDNNFAQNYLEKEIINVDYLEDVMEVIKVEDGGNFFAARENEIFAKISTINGEYEDSIKYTKNSIKNYQTLNGKNHRDTLNAHLYLAKTYFEIDLVEKAREVLIGIVSDSEFDSFPTIHLNAWSLLSTIEVYHGNTRDEFLIRKIFFEKYFHSVKNLYLWNSEIDNIYLEEFAVNLDFLNCNESFESIKQFNEIKKVREKKYGESFINIAYYDIDMQVAKSEMYCSKNEKEKNIYKNKIINSLTANLDELYDPWQIYQHALYLASIDTDDHRVKGLNNEFALKAQSILLEIFDMVESGELENPFDQFLTDTIIYPLAFNLQYLDKNIQKDNLIFINKVVDFYLNNIDGEEVMTQAFQNLRSELTSNLFEQEFIKEGIFYNNLFNDYEDKITRIDDIRIFKDESLLNESKILSNAYEWVYKCKNLNCNKNINKLLNSISSYEKDPIFLALYLEKNTKKNISEFIQQEFSVLDQKNKYLEKQASYKGLNNNDLLLIENTLIDSVKELSLVTDDNREQIQKYIYPTLDIDRIQKQLKNNELIISVTSIPLRTKVLSVILYIADNDLSVKILPNSYEDSLANSFNTLNNLSSNVNNLSEISEIKKISKEISNQILKDSQINISNKKTIFFTSNLHDTFNPNLLMVGEKWIVNDYDIGYFLDWASFTLKNPKKIRNKYHGYGNVDYSNHDEDYAELSETLSEVVESSKFFKNSKSYLGQKVTEKNIILGSKKNSVIHFATHNTSITKYGLNNIPALVVSKTDNNNGDGYLDAFEIQKIDLSNSDIILSACSTLYSKNSTDNFSKLIRAFKISGSRSIMATRWDVESQSAVLISTNYAENLSKGFYPYESISNIQRKFLANSEYNHPAFWAAYVTIIN